MALLDELNSSITPVNLDDLSTVDENLATKVGNTASNRNRAAYVASLAENPEDSIPLYEEVASDYEVLGSSPKGDEVVQRSKETTRTENQGTVADLLANPDLSDPMKVAIARNHQDLNGPQYEPRRMVATKTLSQPSRNESHEAEVVRVDVAGALDSVHNYQNDVQSLLNSEVAKVDSSLGEAFVELSATMLPFVDQTYTQDISARLAEAQGGDSSRIRDFMLSGQGKQAIITALKNASPEARLDMAKAIIEATNKSTDAISLMDENDYAKVNFLRTFLETGYYETSDQYIDNAVSLLDLVGVGGLTRNAVRGVKGLLAGEEAVSNLRRQFVRTHTKPVAPANTFKNTNPSASRDMHEAAAADGSGEVARAIYGTDPLDAVGGDLAPNVTRTDGHVQVRTHNPSKAHEEGLTPDAEIIDMVENRDGATRFTDGEKKRVRAQVFNDIKNATGLTLRNEASAIGRDIDDSVKIQAVYGQTEGGFADGILAVDHTALALRDLGVTRDNITLLKREGEEYVPVDINGPLQPGDYLTSVDFNYKINPSDVTAWDHFDVKRNIFDRIGFGLSEKFGTVQRHFVDPFSSLHPKLTLPANTAVDKISGLEHSMLDLGKQFTDQFVKLDKQTQAAVTDYIKEANANGLPLRLNDLVARGFKGKEIKTLASWKKYWDTQYWLENRDLARTLKNRGYKQFVDLNNNTQLFAKPIKYRGNVGDSAKVYNPATHQIEHMDVRALDDLYNQQGVIAKLRSPMNHNGDIVEFIRSAENTSSGYLRSLNDWDQVLNYRHGYYQVQYKTPKFIVQRVKDKSGKVIYQKAVGTAADTHDATVQAKRWAAHTGGRFDNLAQDSDFFIRDDIKRMSVDSDDYWNLNVGTGRTSQRVRGQRLEDASSPVNFGTSHDHILGPVDSLIHSARSISNRVHMRDYLDTAKTRFLDQYGHLVPKDKFQQPVWPNRLSELDKPGRRFDKDLADARTTWEYINSLESGYINSLDEGMRAVFNLIGDMTGKINATKGNKALSAVERYSMYLSEGPGIIDLAKNVAFTAYIATNPIRQYIVQGHQATLLAANFPKYVLGQGLANDLSAFLMMKAGIPDKVLAKSTVRDVKELREMIKEFEASGLAASIDKQTLIRGSLTQTVENQKYKNSKVGRVITSPISGLRRIGFDAGEYMNISSAWLSYYDKFKNEKGVLTKADYDNISGLARSYTLNMSRAGDMPYNQNMLSMVFQFMQVPHKMFMQSFNRTLSREERARLLSYNTVMFGTVGYGGAQVVETVFGDVLPDDQSARDMVVQGLEGWMFNKGLSLMAGEETRIDWSGLAPQDMYGTMDFLHGLITTDIGKIVASSPSGQLFFGNNDRFTNAFRTASRYFNVTDDYETSEMVTKFSHVAHDFLSISSMYSNAFKAAYLFKYGEKVNALGGGDPNKITPMEALAKTAGFNTMDEAATQYLNNTMYAESKAFRDDVNAWYREAKKQALRDTKGSEEEHMIRIVGEAWRVFGDNEPAARQIVMDNLKKDVADKDMTLYNRILRSMQWNDYGTIRNQINTMPNYDPEKKEALLNTLEQYEQMKEIE